MQNILGPLEWSLGLDGSNRVNVTFLIFMVSLDFCRTMSFICRKIRGGGQQVGNILSNHEKTNFISYFRISMRLRLFQEKKKLKQTSEGIIVKIALGSLL